MTPTLRATTVAAATSGVLVVLLAACSGAPAAGPPAAGPAAAGPPAATTDPGVVWMDGACGALLPLRGIGGRISQVTDPDTGGLTSVLDAVGTGVHEAMANLGGVGTSPIAGGDQAVAEVRDALGRADAGIARARSRLAATPATDGVADDVAAALSPLDSISALTGREDNPELAHAAQLAATCRTLTGRA